MATEHDSAADHCGIDCPECQAFSASAKVMGGFAEAMEAMIEDGTFCRMGYEAGKRREEAVLKAILSPPGGLRQPQ